MEPARVVVYGVTGSQKSTLARRIGEHLGLPWHSIDDLMWEPGWVPVSTELQRERIAAVCAGDSWVIDSAYGAWLDIPLNRADLIVGLDYPRWVSMSRLIRRSVRRIVQKTVVCNGNVETWRDLLRRDSIVWWHFQSFARKRRRMRRWQTDPAMAPVLLFGSPRAVDEWLNGMPTEAR